MKGSVLLMCAVACTANVYGKDEMSDAEIVQNSTLISKDMFEIVPLMGADTERDETMEQDDSRDSSIYKKSAHNETRDSESKFGVDSAAAALSRISHDTKQSNTHASKDKTVPKDKNKETPEKIHKKSVTTTSTPFTFFMAPQHSKKEKREIQQDTSCKQIAIKVPSTCYKDETIEMPYQCQKDVVKKECKMVNVDVPSTCQKTEYTEEEYPCFKTRNVCRDVVKQCERIEYKEEEYVCAPPTCKLVKKQVPSTCTRKVKAKKNVQCPPPKKCKKIKMIDQSYPCGTRTVCTDEIKTDAVCYRSIQVDEEYECLKQAEKTSVLPHFGKHSKHDASAAGTNDIIRKENCKDVTIQVPSECTKTEVERKPYPCFKTEEKQVCKNVTVRVPGVCTKSTKVDELYDCQERSMDSTELDTAQGAIVCQDDMDETTATEGSMDSAHDTMRKPRQLKHAKKSKCKRACKVRKVMKEEPYKCEKTQVVKECNTVPTQVQSTCFQEKTVEKKYGCTLPKTVEQCEKMYTRCTRKKTIKEPYTCEKKEKKCENVPQTCYKKVPLEYEEDCLVGFQAKPKHVAEGDDMERDDMERDDMNRIGTDSRSDSHKKKSDIIPKKKAPQVCTETVEQDEQYECKKTIQVEECSKEKVCKRKVAFPILEECTQRECHDLQTKSNCSRTVPVVKDYECMKKERVEQCEDKMHKALSTCIKTITKPKAYLCNETQYQTICTGPKKK